MCDRCHSKYGRYCETTIRLTVLFFELVVAECTRFHASRNLFPDFGYGKLQCVFAIIDLIRGT